MMIIEIPPFMFPISCLPKHNLLGCFVRAVRVAPFSNRLAHAVPAHIQGLRCLANFEALRFADPIRLLAEQMVNRMVTKSVQSSGNYVSVHLRFEMVFIYIHTSC